MITSTKNPKIVEARKLTLRKHRQRQDRFLAEGLQLLALAAEVMARTERVKPLELFYCESLFTGPTAPRLLAQLTAAGATPVPVDANVMNALSDREQSQGLAVTFALSALEWSLAEMLAALARRQQYRLVLVLDKLQDPGNLGTLIRTADAVGDSAIILLEPGVDPFDPKTVRGTMGSLFTVPFARAQTAAEIMPPLAALGYRLVGADGSRGESVWDSPAMTGPVGLVLGNEARGLSPELHPYLTDYVSLPLRGHAESLNVSIAGGILMYEWLRVNRR
jgi:TrmH family RNA methyltransferase